MVKRELSASGSVRCDGFDESGERPDTLFLDTCPTASEVCCR